MSGLLVDTAAFRRGRDEVAKKFSPDSQPGPPNGLTAGRFPFVGAWSAMIRLTAFSRTAAVALLGLHMAVLAAPAAVAQDEEEDPPARAARLTALSGDVGFRSAQDEAWSDASANRPLTNGDQLDLSSGARAELDFGGGQLRLGGETRATVDRLDDQVARVRLEEGTANLRVEQVERDPVYEIETPRVSFIPSSAGEYRVDVDRDGNTTVALHKGGGTVYGDNGARYEVRGNQSYQFSDAGLQDVVGGPLPERDDFDRWVDARDGRYGDRPARNYVSEGVVGYRDLDDHGRWESVSDYGPVWYPTVVVQDWAPYRYGHWVVVHPWGWTWVDDAPWGYAPFHYGRWVSWHGRWGWVPGPRHVRPVYAPALVGFIGGPSLTIGFHSGPPVGWFPLGPRDVYCPPYRVTRNYFTQVNVTNVTVNHTVINNVYEDVHVHRHGVDRMRYAYRGDANATTVVSGDDFRHGRRVNEARVQMKPDQLARASVTTPIDAPREVRRGRDRTNTGRHSRPDRAPQQDAARDRPRPRANDADDAAARGNAPSRDVDADRRDQARRDTRVDRDRNAPRREVQIQTDDGGESRRRAREPEPRKAIVREPAPRDRSERGMDRNREAPVQQRSESPPAQRIGRAPDASREERPSRSIQADRQVQRDVQRDIQRDIQRDAPQVREERSAPRSFGRPPRQERPAPPQRQSMQEPRMQEPRAPRHEMPQRQAPQQVPQQVPPPREAPQSQPQAGGGNQQGARDRRMDGRHGSPQWPSTD